MRKLCFVMCNSNRFILGSAMHHILDPINYFIWSRFAVASGLDMMGVSVEIEDKARKHELHHQENDITGLEFEADETASLLA